MLMGNDVHARAIKMNVTLFTTCSSHVVNLIVQKRSQKFMVINVKFSAEGETFGGLFGGKISCQLAPKNGL